MIGIFDSGIGGLTVLKELLALMPQLDYVYLGDTARTPYGTKGRETVVRYSLECAQFLAKKNIEILVVACNTASSFALDDLRKSFPIPVIGTIESASKLAVSVTKNEKIGVIGTEATINSGVYQDQLKKLVPEAAVYASACPLFVPLAEQGMFEGDITDRVTELYLAPLKKSGVDTLILGCTHYPMLKNSISAYMGSQVKIVECSKSIAEEVEKLKSPDFVQNSARQYCVTDEVQRFNTLSGLFLDFNNISAVKVSL